MPKEHGASAIWLSSVLLAFGTLEEPPPILGVVVFLTASVLALVLVGKVTSGSQAVARLERNQVLLPVLSSLLTLIVPLGQIIMVGRLSYPILACWLAFLTYCSSGVVYTRDLVRSVLKEASPKWTSFSVSAAVIMAVVATLSALNWLSIVALAIIVPLIIHRLVVLLIFQRRGSLRVERIRRVGFTQAGNLIAAVIILSLVSRP